MSELISVIVPVYNVKDYLEKCVDSILSQTYSELEVLLIDDGSTDGSSLICDILANKDNRIKVIHQDNGGLSAARNTGLDIATGEYIAFVDSDDYIKKTMYADMLRALNDSDADIAIGGIRYIDEKDNPLFDISLDELVEVEDEREKYSQLQENDILTVVQWNKLYRKEIFKDIRYPVGKIHEDVYVAHRELYNANKIIFIPGEYYYYVQRIGSIMNKDESISQIIDAINGYEERIDFFKKIEEEDAYKSSIMALYDYITWKYDSMYGVVNKDKLDKIVDELRRISDKFGETLKPIDKVLNIINHRVIYNIRLRYLRLKGI